jgi:hypothetical protein
MVSGGESFPLFSSPGFEAVAVIFGQRPQGSVNNLTEEII